MALNQQGDPKKGTRGIEWTHFFGEGSGYTWNPVSGCQHDCRWTMPDGTTAICYAKLQAERQRSEKFFPNGFEEVTFHLDRLMEPLLKTDPCGIFLDSMSDIMGKGVPDHVIHQVLNTVTEAKWHTFFLLTKAPGRLLKFGHLFPDNLWIGVSSPPDWMNDGPLNRAQQEKMLRRTLMILSVMKTPVRWISAEPLSWDISPILREYPNAINWMVVGAASNGRKHYAPDETALRNTLAAADDLNIPVFFKGNLRSSALPEVHNNWREEYPFAGQNPHAIERTMRRMTDEQWKTSLGRIFDGLAAQTETPEDSDDGTIL